MKGKKVIQKIVPQRNSVKHLCDGSTFFTVIVVLHIDFIGIPINLIDFFGKNTTVFLILYFFKVVLYTRQKSIIFVPYLRQNNNG